MERNARVTYGILGALVFFLLFIAITVYFNRERYLPWLNLLLTQLPGSPRLTDFAPQEASELQIQQFLNKLRAASATDSLNEVYDLIYTPGATKQEIDKMIRMVDIIRKNVDPEQLEFQSMSSFGPDTPAFMFLPLKETMQVNGLTKRMNLDTVGFVLAHQPYSQTGKQVRGNIIPVGLTPSGELKIMVPTERGTPIYTPLPAQESLPPAQSVSQKKWEAFTAKVEQVFADNDWRGYLDLHDLRGTNQERINKAAEGFLLMQSNQGLEIEKASFERYGNFTSRSGEGTELNLPIVGSVVLHFKTDTTLGSFPYGINVGVNENGELMIPLFQAK